MSKNTSCANHTGKPFKSMSAMRSAWNISPGTYNVRIKKGMPLEEALTTPVKTQDNEPKKIKDNNERHENIRIGE